MLFYFILKYPTFLQFEDKKKKSSMRIHILTMENSKPLNANHLSQCHIVQVRYRKLKEIDIQII